MITDTELATDDALRMDDLRVRAMLTADWDALDRMLAEDLLYIHTSGRLDSKASYMAALRSGKTRYVSIDRPANTVNLQGNAATVMGPAHLKVMANGVEHRLDCITVSVWKKSGGRWRAAVVNSVLMKK